MNLPAAAAPRSRAFCARWRLTRREAPSLPPRALYVARASERLGHSSIGITADRYLTVYKERDAAAANAFERLVS
jgi:hypothetical protein